VQKVPNQNKINPCKNFRGQGQMQEMQKKGIQTPEKEIIK